MWPFKKRVEYSDEEYDEMAPPGKCTTNVSTYDPYTLVDRRPRARMYRMTLKEYEEAAFGRGDDYE